MSTPSMTCQELFELVTAYLEGQLPSVDRMRFEVHLGVCDPCRIYLDQMRETIRLTGTLEEETVSPEARDALLAAFRDWRA